MTITQISYSMILIIWWIYKIKTEGIYEDFIKNKKMYDLSNYLLRSKYYDDSHKLKVRWKMKQGVSLLKKPNERYIQTKNIFILARW